MNGRSKSREVDPVKRRDIIAGLVPADVSSAAEEHDTKSLYIPRTQLIEDRTFVHEFMDEYSFVDLVTGHLRFALRVSRCCSTGAPVTTASFTATSLARILKAVHSMASITP